MASARLMSMFILLALATSLLLAPGAAQLRQHFYAETCPHVENIVRRAVAAKFRRTFVTVPGTLRLFFHDCFIRGCDASIIIHSNDGDAEKDHPENQSLAGDGFDTVIKAKAAVDAVPRCRNKVSCADILALAARDVIVLVGGPPYEVELGRRDGLSSTMGSVDGKIPKPEFDLDQLTSLFASNGLNQTDMIALSAAHSVGFAHCNTFSKRIYNFSATSKVDTTLDGDYASQLQGMCPEVVDPTVAINMDPVTPRRFDNQYFRNLQEGRGLFSSDQILFTDDRSRQLVDTWARDPFAFNRAFVSAMTKLGRVGVKTGSQGDIRIDCSRFNI